MSRMLRATAFTLAALVAASQARAAAVDLSAFQLNGGATASANDLNLGDGNGGEAMSGFMTSAISAGSNFSGAFDLSMVDSTGSTDANGLQGDGLTFVIQNDPAGASALGGGGGGIGADGIQNSVGIGFQSWDNDHATIFHSGDPCPDYGAVTYCGTQAHHGDQQAGNFLLGGNLSNHVHVTFSYAGGVLSYTALNSDTSQSISDSYAFNLGSLGPQVYVGFTGGTGLAWSVQDVSNFDLNVSAAPEPTSWALMVLGFGGLGAVLRNRRRGALAV